MKKFLSLMLIASIGLMLMNSCAGTAPAPKTVEAPIVMPSGWDDAVIDKIKSGQGTRYSLAVLTFDGKDKLQGKADLSMADMLTTALVNTKRFDLVERNKIDKIIEEQSLGLTGLVDESTAAKVGELLGAEYIVTGVVSSATRKDIDKFGYMLVQIEVGIDVRAINTSTGEILMSDAAVGLNENKIVKTADGTVVSGAIDYKAAYAAAARDAVNKVAEKLASRSPLIGFIVAAGNGDVTLDIGEDRGIRSGDQLVAFRVGNELKHPATGAHLGWEKTPLAILRVTASEKSLSRAAIVRSKADVTLQAGDFVISR